MFGVKELKRQIEWLRREIEILDKREWAHHADKPVTTIKSAPRKEKRLVVQYPNSGFTGGLYSSPLGAGAAQYQCLGSVQRATEEEYTVHDDIALKDAVQAILDHLKLELHFVPKKTTGPTVLVKKRGKA